MRVGFPSWQNGSVSQWLQWSWGGQFHPVPEGWKFPNCDALTKFCVCGVKIF